MLKHEELFQRGEMLYPGHTGCPGCGAALAVRWLTRFLGPDLSVVIPACCWSIISGSPPLTALKCPILHTPFPSAAAAAGGLKRGLELKGNHTTTVAVLSGDGGTFDIGFQALSGAAQRNENFIYICYDNEAYMNTGLQTSSATPFGSQTNTAPFPRYQERRKKNIMGIMAEHNIPYAASATVAFPEDMAEKFKRATQIQGFRFFHILAPCPPGWGIESSETIEYSRLAVDSCLFPLLEVYEGNAYELNYHPERKIPLKDYLAGQRRFKSLESWQIENMQHEVDVEWKRLLKTSI